MVSTQQRSARRRSQQTGGWKTNMYDHSTSSLPSSRPQHQAMDDNKRHNEGNNYRFLTSSGTVAVGAFAERASSAANNTGLSQRSPKRHQQQSTTLASELNQLTSLGDLTHRASVSGSNKRKKQPTPFSLESIGIGHDDTRGSKARRQLPSARALFYAAAGTALLLNLNGVLDSWRARFGRQTTYFYQSGASARRQNVDPFGSPSPSESLFGAQHLRRTQAVEATKFAIVRPFSPRDVDKMVESFDKWEEFTPCDANHPLRAAFNVDLFLSFSQLYADHPEILTKIGAVSSKFKESQKSGWGKCFGEIFLVEANTPADVDRYNPSVVQTDKMWVNGPNRQFVSSCNAVRSRGYEGMFNMEADSTPRKPGWLDHLLNEIDNQSPFVILGSKYNGHSWDGYLDKIPISLLHHINGNAVYNTSHPLMNLVIEEIIAEANTMYNAIPYDYRISQMMVQGSMGRHSPDIGTEFPHKLIKEDDGSDVVLERKTEKFVEWWDLYGKERPYRESHIISNLAATNYLPSQLNDESIVHGDGLYEPHDPNRHRITLVVTDWEKDYASSLLASVERSRHPFSEVLVMRPPKSSEVNTFSKFFGAIWEKRPTIPVRVQHRNGPDYMDLCEAPVSTGWFMITNSYHQLVDEVDLMFTPGMHKAVAPYTPTVNGYCDQFGPCKDSLNQAREIWPDMDKVFLDGDVLFRTSDRDEFCHEWKSKFGRTGANLPESVRTSPQGPRGPTATSYMAFLEKIDIAKELYDFTDKTLRGSKDAFVKVFTDEEAGVAVSMEQGMKNLGSVPGGYMSGPINDDIATSSLVEAVKEPHVGNAEPPKDPEMTKPPKPEDAEPQKASAEDAQKSEEVPKAAEVSTNDEEPKSEEPKSEEPKSEEPKSEEPEEETLEEPMSDERKGEETTEKVPTSKATKPESEGKNDSKDQMLEKEATVMADEQGNSKMKQASEANVEPRLEDLPTPAEQRQAEQSVAETSSPPAEPAKPAGPVSDGTPCKEDGDCKSKYCRSGGEGEEKVCAICGYACQIARASHKKAEKADESNESNASPSEAESPKDIEDQPTHVGTKSSEISKQQSNKSKAHATASVPKREANTNEPARAEPKVESTEPATEQSTAQ